MVVGVTVVVVLVLVLVVVVVVVVVVVMRIPRGISIGISRCISRGISRCNSGGHPRGISIGLMAEQNPWQKWLFRYIWEHFLVLEHQIPIWLDFVLGLNVRDTSIWHSKMIEIPLVL